MNCRSRPRNLNIGFYPLLNLQLFLQHSMMCLASIYVVNGSNSVTLSSASPGYFYYYSVPHGEVLGSPIRWTAERQDRPRTAKTTGTAVRNSVCTVTGPGTVIAYSSHRVPSTLKSLIARTDIPSISSSLSPSSFYHGKCRLFPLMSSSAPQLRHWPSTSPTPHSANQTVARVKPWHAT